MPKISQLEELIDKSQLTADDYIVVNDGTTTKKISAQTFANRQGTGWTVSYGGGFASSSMAYTTEMAEDGKYMVVSLDPTETMVGEFDGDNLPVGVDTMLDFSFDFNTEYPTLESFTSQVPSSSAQDAFEVFQDSTGRIKLNGLLPGDQLRVRFDFNAVPQISNTTVEPVLWYSNRNSEDKETATFPLAAQPITFGLGSPGKTFLNRVEMSAWIANDEDVNALVLPAIKSTNPILIEPLSMLITVLR